MSSSGPPDLFVVCKTCGSEVSPYITECPYCGSRLRKRAPKLDREGRPAEKPKRRISSSLPPLRRGEIPGIRVDARPFGTALLVVSSLLLLLLYRAGVVSVDELVVIGSVGADWWRVFTAGFVYDNLGYAFIALLAVGVFGWLLERRHGPVGVVLLFLSASALGMLAVSAVESYPTASGGNAGALALVCAWAVRPLSRCAAARTWTPTCSACSSSPSRCCPAGRRARGGPARGARRRRRRPRAGRRWPGSGADDAIAPAGPASERGPTRDARRRSAPAQAPRRPAGRPRSWGR